MSPYSTPTLSGAILVLLIGAFVFTKNSKSAVNISFAMFCLSVFVWLFAYTIAYSTESLEVATFYTTLACTAVIFTAPTAYHFFAEYLGFQKLRKTIIIPYIIMGILTPLFFMTNYFLDKPHKAFWGYYSTAGPLHPVYMLIHFAIVGAAFFLLYRKYFKETGITSVEKVRLKYIFWSYIIAAFSAIDFTQKYGAEFYPFGFIFVVAFVTVTAYSILRYRLMDIRLIFKRTMVYSLSAGLLTGFFIVFVLTITKLISTFAEVDSFKVSIFAALVIALLFNPLRIRIQTLVDKLFYKKTYDYYATIRKVSHDLASMFNLKKIYSFVGDIIFSTLGLKNIYLLSAVLGRDYEVVYSRSFGKDEGEKEEGEGKGEEEWGEDKKALKIAGNSDMIKLLRTSDDIVIKDELPGIKEILGQETIDNITSTLKPFNGEAVMPIFINDKLELMLILGEKLSGDIFTNEDINLLDTISHETAIAIKNAQLYAEKFRSEKLASIGMMSATFAHEMRNPLTSIKTFAQLIPEKYTDTEFRETFSKIVIDEIARIDGLIGELMDFSSGRALPCIDNVDITALIDETLEYLKGKLELEKRNINIEKIYKIVKINILGDSKKLKQAFINIITNSFQAMHENGVLKVNINLNGRGDVDITITDTGKGIPSQDITKIFDPFYTTKPMGVGLGLAISKKVIEDHGGRIVVKSKLSRGTTFTISLPVENN